MNTAESDYYRFMGFDSEGTREAQRHYVAFFDSGPVLELGCGRGEFLDDLREAGIEARGVDVDDGMVAQARSAGHDVALADVVDHLRSLPEGSLGGVFAAHLLEHLPAERVEQLYGEVARVLRPGGPFVAVVPNAACRSVLAYDFWRDPTHVRFYDPMVLAFFAHRGGLRVVDQGPNPRNHPGPPPHLIPIHFTSAAALTDQISEAVRAAGTPSPGADPAQAWARVGHIAAELDRRLQDLQHQVGVLHACYNALLAELYQANEVYVVAVREAQ